MHTCGQIHGFIEALGWLGTDLKSPRTGDSILGWIAKRFGSQRNGGCISGQDWEGRRDPSGMRSSFGADGEELQSHRAGCGVVLWFGIGGPTAGRGWHRGKELLGLGGALGILESCGCPPPQPTPSGGSSAPQSSPAQPRRETPMAPHLPHPWHRPLGYGHLGQTVAKDGAQEEGNVIRTP